MTRRVEPCGYRWPLPSAPAAQHQCGRPMGHFGPHRCAHDGTEAER